MILQSKDGLNVCYDPIGNYTLPPTTAPTISPAPTPVVPTSPPVELYGDCEFSYPSAAPSPYPTEYPSRSPSKTPTLSPSDAPSLAPSLSAAPTSSPVPSLAPTYQGFCEPNENGMFGVEASNADVVNYEYELVTDPSQDFDMEEIVSLVSQSVVQSVLPTLFSDECTEAPAETSRRRRLENATLYEATGASTSSESILDGGECDRVAIFCAIAAVGWVSCYLLKCNSCLFKVNCTTVFDETYDCLVINANMLVYTNGNETYDDALLPIIKESMDNGAFNDLNSAIINTTFVNQTESSGDEASGSNSSGIQNPAWFALVGVAVVAVVVGFVVWKKRKREASSRIQDCGSGSSKQRDQSHANRGLRKDPGRLYSCGSECLN